MSSLNTTVATVIACRMRCLVSDHVFYVFNLRYVPPPPSKIEWGCRFYSDFIDIFVKQLSEIKDFDCIDLVSKKDDVINAINTWIKNHLNGKSDLYKFTEINGEFNIKSPLDEQYSRVVFEICFKNQKPWRINARLFLHNPKTEKCEWTRHRETLYIFRA